MNDAQLARQLADQTAALHQAAARCRELAGQGNLHTPLIVIITDRISALVEELRWEVATAAQADPEDGA